MRQSLAMALFMGACSIAWIVNSAQLPISWITGEGPGGGAFPFWLAIGIYDIGEILWTIETSRGDVQVSQATVNFKRILHSLKPMRQSVKTMLMGSFLGYFLGILPAAGAIPGSLMAYGSAKSMSKEPETFGKGNINGVAAPEAANNAASTGPMLPMLPMLTLGIPGSPTTAILLGGVVIWRLRCLPSCSVRWRRPACAKA